MKKLLLLISIWGLTFAGKCGGVDNSAGVTDEEKNMADTTKSAVQNSEPGGQANVGSSTAKDSVKGDSPAVAHIHGAPNQDKIDSIKNEKLKGKIPK